MNGAEILCDTLLANGIDVCFANPGTSEMHFVAALDRRPQMRCVLGLAEGVVTGAADGFGRMADRPAATLLHLGPGLGNGIANLHNARRARTPLVNIVGDHASDHLGYDAPLTTDIEGLARPVSDWVGRIDGPGDIVARTNEAIGRALHMPGVATLILPADAAWGDAPDASPTRASRREVPKAEDAAIRAAAKAVREGHACILLSGATLRETPLRLVEAIADRYGCKALTATAAPRVERGAGRPAIERLPYPMEVARAVLAGFRSIILIGATAPVAFFAYPGRDSRLTPPGASIIELADRHHDGVDAIMRLAEELAVAPPRAAPVASRPADAGRPVDGPLTPESIAAVVARLMPDGAIVCDEMLTSEGGFYARSMQAAPHDYLALTGGAIGIGIPMATGAAIAAPGRKVISLQADGSGMYSVQGLWTQAREALDVVTVVYANRAYRILEGELRNVGVNEAGPNARRMLELDGPVLDWVSLARGLGVAAVRVDDTGAFERAFRAALAEAGPFVIEAVI